MRTLALLLFTLTASLASAADGVSIVRLLEGYKPAADFVRISEYFNGKENTGGATIVRTQPAQRGGYYFTLRTRSATAREVVFIELQVITPTQADARTESFAIPLPAGSHLIQFGLTGTDWPSPKAHPVAWKLRLIDTAGQELASEQSFLWSKPPAVAALPTP